MIVYTIKWKHEDSVGEINSNSFFRTKEKNASKVVNELKKRFIINIMESLILAQDERWRRA